MVFVSDRDSRTSLTPSVAIEGHSCKQRLHLVFLWFVRMSGLRKPIDTDSKSKFQRIRRYLCPASLGNIYLTWLLFVAMGYLYNLISVPLRIAFLVWCKGQKSIWIWMCIDYF